MTEAPSELWLPAERAYTTEPPQARTAEAVGDERAFTDLHGPQPRARRDTVTIHRPEICCDRVKPH